MGSFNSNERRGAIVLLGVIIVVAAAMFLTRRCSASRHPDGAPENPEVVWYTDSASVPFETEAESGEAFAGSRKKSRKVKVSGRGARGKRSGEAPISKRMPRRDILGDTIITDTLRYK